MLEIGIEARLAELRINLFIVDARHFRPDQCDHPRGGPGSFFRLVDFEEQATHEGRWHTTLARREDIARETKPATALAGGARSVYRAFPFGRKTLVALR
jgi:hypothetical protein